MFTPEQVALIKSQFIPKASDNDLKMFIAQCERTGLDPFARQIVPMMKRAKVDNEWVDRLSVQVSIDGFRLIAERTNDYAGQTPVYWCGPDGKWVDVWLQKSPPAASKVGVYRKGFTEPVWAVATWGSYCQTTREGGPAGNWARMGDVMIAKCAEALALRKAFPNDLSGLYSTDEMEQSANDAPAPAPAPSQSTPRQTPAPAPAQTAPEPSATAPATEPAAPADEPSNYVIFGYTPPRVPSDKAFESAAKKSHMDAFAKELGARNFTGTPSALLVAIAGAIGDESKSATSGVAILAVDFVKNATPEQFAAAVEASNSEVAA